MSDLVIRDGVGTGTRAQVDAFHRLKVFGIVQPELYSASNAGLSFVFAVNDISVPATEATILYFQNTDPVNNFHIHEILAGWNGGSTTHARTLIGRFYAGMSAPTANSSTLVPVNLNTTSTTSPTATILKWNGSGTGLTVASNGALAFSTYVGMGCTSIDFHGAFVIGYNKVIGITLQGEEAGLASIQLVGWVETAGE